MALRKRRGREIAVADVGVGAVDDANADGVAAADAYACDGARVYNARNGCCCSPCCCRIYLQEVVEAVAEEAAPAMNVCRSRHTEHLARAPAHADDADDD